MKKYKIKACTVMDMRNGKINKQQIYFDQLSFFGRLGFLNRNELQ